MTTRMTTRDAALVADYASGLKRKELATKYGICLERVRQILRKANVIPRNQFMVGSE
jgi:Mor family transcriptional regulator